MLIVLFAVAVWAGVQNALAGGGSFVTLPALMLSGLDARAANIVSTLALFPGQVTTGLVNRKLAGGAAGLSFGLLIALSLAGGLVGAGLLLMTPVGFFTRLLPWLVLFATALFALGAFLHRREGGERRMSRAVAATAQFLIAVYGGYFGGGIGFLMLAVLTAAGLTVRAAGATKNMLASVMNAAAVAVFVFTPHLPWTRVVVIALGAVAGGLIGAAFLRRVDERLIAGFVIVLGLALTGALFLGVA